MQRVNAMIALPVYEERVHLALLDGDARPSIITTSAPTKSTTRFALPAVRAANLPVFGESRCACIFLLRQRGEREGVETRDLFRWFFSQGPIGVTRLGGYFPRGR